MVKHRVQPKGKKYSFEEVKLYYESAEKVTDRRISSNKYNFSICVGIIFVIANIWNWSISNKDYPFAIYIVILLFSLMAIIYCIHWIHQISDYKRLNAAKFEILNEMCKKVHIETGDQKVDLVSYCPFDKEWDLIGKANGLTKFQGTKALKSTNAEYFVPWSFIVLFALISICSLTLTIIHILNNDIVSVIIKFFADFT